MIGRHRAAAREVVLAEVVDMLAEAESELGFEQARALAYARKFAKLPKDKAEQLITELMQNPRITRAKAVKLADLLPTDATTIKLIFAKEIYQPSEEDIARIIETISKYK